MSRLDTDRQKELEPKRIEFAVQQLEKTGIVIDLVDDTKIKFKWENEWVTFFPYSGWASGKSIKDGRGIDNLLKQLKP